ncbi:multiple epidermal growth factor-like domains protein 11 isoform X2 [Ostrea edulis]|nr:multiple epidermal growth factor-like domains protein 11 isoform X2 [Ostrea edulis]
MDLLKLSDGSCYQDPGGIFSTQSLQLECKKVTEKVLTLYDLFDPLRTISCDCNELDCSGIPFARDVCVPCKSYCPSNITCLVLAGSCLTNYISLNDSDTGVERALRCPEGYRGENCSDICDTGFYGKLCDSRCSNHCLQGDCHHVNGTCLKGCNSGWKGDKCDSPDCPKGQYGEGCTGVCSPNCRYSCSPKDGVCYCSRGWQAINYQGVFCNKPCKPGTHGDGCTETCGKCRQGTTCFPNNGTCPDGCNKPGYYFTNSQCTWELESRYLGKCRRNTYGINCEKNCSDSCLNRRCRNTDGMCLRCPPGYQGFNCTSECSIGKFGDKCNGKCHCEGGSACNHINGKCPGKCDPGFHGESCDRKVCEPGLYGRNCDKWCFCKEGEPCDWKTGRCKGACQKGWRYSSCDIRDECYYPEYDRVSPTWDPKSIGIGIAVGFVATFFVTCCGLFRSNVSK